MLQARMILDRDYELSAVDPRLFGGFAEHLGRCVYEGMYEPEHPAADEYGFRTDVLELLRRLDMPVMRYPGGNFVSGYNWEDGVGPREHRPKRLDPAWRSTEPNHFGTNEFVHWCHKLGTEPMLAVNLGTRGPEEARQLVEYCNYPGGTAWSDLRRDHGYLAPHDIKLWCLGNEMDGAWQMGHKTPTEYGRIAREAAKLMRWVDPSIELVVCGSCGRGLPTFGEWELEVLQHTYDVVQYVSIHTYLGNGENDLANFLAKPDAMGAFIDEVTALCDAVKAKRRDKRPMMLAFDEWNVWYKARGVDHSTELWPEAPHILEEVYTMADALVVGGMLIELLNHADRVKIGCLAQIVNVIAPIMTAKGGPAWKQTIYHPIQQASASGRGTVLRTVIDSPGYDCKEREGAPYLKAAAVIDPESGTLKLFALNRSLTEPMTLIVDLRAFGTFRQANASVLRDDDPDACNTQSQPDRVQPQTGATPHLDGTTLTCELPPTSWNRITLCGAY